MRARPTSAASMEELLAHAGWLRRLSRRLLSDRDLADDVTQDVWVSAVRTPPAADRPPRPWLREVLFNSIRMRARRERSRARVEGAAAPVEAAWSSPERVVERLDLHRVLVDCVMTLDEDLRQVVLMRFFEEQSSIQIGALLGIPAGTVRWRLKVGLDRLRSELDRRFDGERRRWALALAPVAARATSGAVKGVVLMAKAKVPLAVASAVIAILVVAGWLHRGWRPSGDDGLSGIPADKQERLRNRPSSKGGICEITLAPGGRGGHDRRRWTIRPG